MTNKLYETQSKKDGYISTQCEGYHKHNFVLHTYFYNLYFLVKTIFNILSNNTRNLVLSDLIAQKHPARLINKATSKRTERKLFIRHDIFIKDCPGRAFLDSDRYLRIANHTKYENRSLIEALSDVIQSCKLANG